MDEQKAAVIEAIFSEFLAGREFKQLSRFAKEMGFNRAGHDAIKRVLTNPVYAGLIVVPSYADRPERIVKGKHQAIISEETFHAVQERLGLCKPQPKLIENDEVPLRGFVLCQQCGTPLTGGKSKGRTKYYFYYRCNYCTGQNFSAAKSHSQLFEILHQLSLSPTDVKSIQRLAESEFERQSKERLYQVAILEKEVDALTNKLNTVEDKYFSGDVDDATFKKWGGIYRRDLSGKKYELELLQTGKEMLLKRFSEQLPYLGDLSFLWKRADFFQKHLFLELLFGRDLSKLDKGYRTTYLQPIFNVNGKIIKYLDVKETGTPSDGDAQNPGCTPTGLIIEPFLNFFAALKVA